MNQPVVIQNKEDLEERKWRAAAELQGHKFFEVRYMKPSTQTVKITGVKDLRYGINNQRRLAGESEYEFIEVGGHAKFRHDELRFGHYATIYDDKGGYNRQWFATHHEDKEFDILDEEVKKDVAARADKLRQDMIKKLDNQKKDLEKKDKEKPPVMEVSVAGLMICPICRSEVNRSTKWCPKCCKKIE